MSEKESFRVVVEQDISTKDGYASWAEMFVFRFTAESVDSDLALALVEAVAEQGRRNRTLPSPPERENDE